MDIEIHPEYTGDFSFDYESDDGASVPSKHVDCACAVSAENKNQDVGDTSPDTPVGFDLYAMKSLTIVMDNNQTMEQIEQLHQDEVMVVESEAPMFGPTLFPSAEVFWFHDIFQSGLVSPAEKMQLFAFRDQFLLDITRFPAFNYKVPSIIVVTLAFKHIQFSTFNHLRNQVRSLYNWTRHRNICLVLAEVPLWICSSRIAELVEHNRRLEEIVPLVRRPVGDIHFVKWQSIFWSHWDHPAVPVGEIGQEVFQGVFSSVITALYQQGF